MSTPTSPKGWSLRVAVWGLVGLVALTITPLIVGASHQAVSDSEWRWTFAGAGGGTGGASAVELMSVVRTLVYAGLIALLATALGLPVGWAMRSGSAGVVALVRVPLLMPMYLVYSGWGLLRGPGTVLGDLLGRAPPRVSMGANRALAVVGLSLWAWPMAAVIIGMSARRVPGVLLDALSLEPASAWRRVRLAVGLVRPGVIGAFGVVGVVMIGSAIPLHLAQVRTYAIDLWTMVSVSPDIRGVWLRATPLMVVAVLAAGTICRVVMGRDRRGLSDAAPDGRAAGGVGGGSWGGDVPKLVWVISAGVWVVSVLVPMGLFAGHLRHFASIGEFWKFAGGAVLRSLGIASLVGVIVGALAMLTMAAGSGVRRGSGRWVVWGASVAMVSAALVPGILVGVAGQGFWNSGWLPDEAYSSMWPMVHAHVARFGALGVLVGLWLVRRESEDERSARLLMAGDDLWGWWMLRGRRAAGVCVGVGCAAAALSMHEIEAAVTLQAPGPTSVAQYVLDKLHYARDEQLCAACLNLLSMGLVLAGVASALIGSCREVLQSGAGRAA